MAKNTPAMTVSGAGLITGFWSALEKARQKRGVSDADFHSAVVEESPLIERIADMIAESCRPKLLELAGSVHIPATTERFMAKDRFVLDKSDSAKVKISYLGENFKAWLLDKVEEPFGGSTLQVLKLTQQSLDGPIIAELGGEEKAETTLSEIHALMAKQPNGEQGKLLTNGYANIFYVRDITGVLRAVSVYWYGDGWDVYADSISGPSRWDDGFQVFSRNSHILEPSETLALAKA